MSAAVDSAVVDSAVVVLCGGVCPSEEVTGGLLTGMHGARRAHINTRKEAMWNLRIVQFVTNILKNCEQMSPI